MVSLVIDIFIDILLSIFLLSICLLLVFCDSRNFYFRLLKMYLIVSIFLQHACCFFKCLILFRVEAQSNTPPRSEMEPGKMLRSIVNDSSFFTGYLTVSLFTTGKRKRSKNKRINKYHIKYRTILLTPLTCHKLVLKSTHSTIFTLILPPSCL